VPEGRKFDSGYVPVEAGLTLKDIKDRHDLFIADTNSFSGILEGLELFQNFHFTGSFFNAEHLAKTMYGQLKVISELARDERLVTLRRILKTEYQTDKILNSFLENSEIKEIELDEQEAIRLAKTISYQLSLRANLNETCLNFMEPCRKRFLETFLESESCVRDNGEKEVNEVDIMVYVAGLFSTNNDESKNCAILSWDTDLLVQKPLPKRRTISNKKKKRLLSEGITSVPKFHFSPIIYHPDNSKRIGKRIPDTFLRYENLESYAREPLE
jgi:hypothetical protein